MPDMQTLTIYLTAAFVLAVTPGPGIFYVLTRSIKGGYGEGYASALGTTVGGFGHVIAAALGLSAVLATSAVAFNIIKYAGAAYLIYLGIKTILSKDDHALSDIEADTNPNRRQWWQAFYQGITTEVLNPKTALFFLAFIPQFIDPTQSVVSQFLLLGTISVAMNTAADIVVVTLAGPIADRLKRSARLRTFQRRATGIGLIGLGVYVAAIGTNKT